MEARPKHRIRTATLIALLAVTARAAVACGAPGAAPVVTITPSTSAPRVAAGACPAGCMDPAWLRDLEATLRRLHFGQQLPSPAHTGPALG